MKLSELDKLEKVARRLLAVEGMDLADAGEAEAWSDADDAFSEAFTPKTVLRLIAMARGKS